MKFSVVTISFNQAEFLERTIKSVLAQAADGIEIEYIICDPGSTDGSRDIIERYREHFAHILYEKDRGPSDGLNKGFEKATGDVFCYLNSDDTFEPHAFSTVKTYLEAHPDYEVVCGHAWVTDRYDNRLRRVWSEPYNRIFVAYGAAVQIQPSTFIRKAAYLRTNGFNIDNKTNWDGELLADLYLSKANIKIMPYFCSSYRLHEVSITNSGSTVEKMKLYRNYSFHKLMNRLMNRVDYKLAVIYRIIKHLINPLAAYERILKGRIFMRGAK